MARPRLQRTLAATPIHDAAMERRRQARAELIRETLALWQPRTSRQLTEEDARQCLENMVGFFRVLQEWHIAEKREEAAKQESLQNLPNESAINARPHCRHNRKGVD